MSTLNFWLSYNRFLSETLPNFGLRVLHFDKKIVGKIKTFSTYNFLDLCRNYVGNLQQLLENFNFLFCLLLPHLGVRLVIIMVLYAVHICDLKEFSTDIRTVLAEL